MSALEDIQAQVPKAYDEIVRQTNVRPVSVGVTKKGHRLAFLVNLPVVLPGPKPTSLFGIPIVYGIAATPTLLGSRVRRSAR